MFNAKIINILFGFILIIMSGCATIPKEADLRESLRTAAVDYWKLRMAGEYEKTYAMEDREGLSLFKDYVPKAMAIKRMNIISHSIKDINIEGTKGFVDVEFSFTLPPVSKPFKEVIKDQWIFRNGKWFHIMPQ